MAQYNGRVSKLFPSRFGGAFGLEGQYGIYFNTKNPLPADVTEGANVSFEGQMGRNGKSFQVTDSTLKVVAGQPAPSGGGGRSESSGSVQDAIRYQSARKDALVMVGLLVSSGALDLGKTQAKKAGIIEDATDRFTAIYYEDTGTLGALDRTPIPELPKAGATPAPADPNEIPE